MKILFLKEKRSPSGIEGVGIYLLRLCEELNKRNIKYLILYNDNDDFYKKLIDYKINVKLIKFPSQSPRNIYRGFKSIKNKIKKIINDEKITIINAHFPHLLNFVDTKWGIPIYCHSHGADLYNNKISLLSFKNNDTFLKSIIKSFYEKYYIFNFSKASKVITVSQCAKTTAIKKFAVNPKKIFINRYGLPKIIQDKYQNIREIYNIGKKNFLIISVGRITKDKGVEDFCKTAKYLKQKNNNLIFMFIGEYRDKEYYDKIYSNYKNYVIFTGVKENVLDFFKSSDLFLFLSHRESAGQVLMEAMNFSLPLVCWDIIGVNEIVENNKNGYLVKFGEFEDLYDKINLIINNKEKYNYLSKNSFTDSKLYFIEDNVNRLIDIYNA